MLLVFHLYHYADRLGTFKWQLQGQDEVYYPKQVIDQHTEIFHVALMDECPHKSPTPDHLSRSYCQGTLRGKTKTVHLPIVEADLQLNKSIQQSILVTIAVDTLEEWSKILCIIT